MSVKLPVLHGPWSNSRAQSCAMNMLHDKVLKTPPEPRPERFMSLDRREFGSLLHDAADMSIGSFMAGEGWIDSKKLAHHLISSEVEYGGVKTTPYATLSAISGEVVRRIELFHNNFRVDYGMTISERDSLIRNNMLGKEMKIAVDADGNICSFEDCPSDGWRGIIDYAEDLGDDEILIVDLKNRPAMWTKSELKKDEQLSGYVDLIFSHFPSFEKSRAGIYYLEFGITQIIEMSPEDIKTNVENLKSKAAHKESLTMETIVPEPGFGKCQYCDWIFSCDAGQDAMVGGGLTAMDADQARALAGYVLVEEEKLKLAKKTLQIYTGEFGPVELDDKTRVGYSLADHTRDYDKPKVLRIIKGLINSGEIKDKKLSDFTNLNTVELKKWAKRKEIDDALAGAWQPSNKTKFEFFRPAKTGVTVKKVGRKNKVTGKVKRGK